MESRHIQPLIPPRATAVIWTDEAGNDLLPLRNEALLQVKAIGLAEWKRQSGYRRRSKAEVVMFRWKTTFGERLSSRLLTNQQTETQVKASYLNRFTRLGMPKVVKCAPS